MDNLCILFLNQIFSTISIILTIISTGSSTYIVYNYPDQIDQIERYKIVDEFIYKVDQIVCSLECPCDLWNTAPFSYNYIEAYYAKWVKTIKKNGALSFKGCPKDVISKLIRYYLDDLSNKYNIKIEDIPFLMSHLERVLKCSGFYRNEYTIGDDEKMVFKYLFSDINR